MTIQKNPNEPSPAPDSKDEHFSTSENTQKGWLVIAGFVIAMILLVAMQLLRN